MSNLPKSIQKAAIHSILSDAAINMMAARDRAKIFLEQTGRTDAEAFEMIETELCDIAEAYKRTITDKGIKPNLSIQIIPLNQ